MDPYSTEAVGAGERAGLAGSPSRDHILEGEKTRATVQRATQLELVVNTKAAKLLRRATSNDRKDLGALEEGAQRPQPAKSLGLSDLLAIMAAQNSDFSS